MGLSEVEDKVRVKKKLFIVLIGMFFTYISITTATAITKENHINVEEEGHLQLTYEEFQKLLKQGYTVHEIVKAAHISLYTNKGIEYILRFYKKNGSWQETANHFGVDLEKLKTDQMRKTKRLNRQHKEKIITILANYTSRTPEEINDYLKQDADLHFLIVAAAISKTTNTDLPVIIQYNKEGMSFHEIMKTVHANQKIVFREVKILHQKIKNIE
ncbi:hypothetical protein CWO92_18730 [Heyndrickxia camelliae]|uniref:Uncharacterized protein n=1 Tax=Heyndrickxia camelliae TaxID=1707093 RepID=A0A2N3LG66_9BACI|nr:hypothetical protein CWO92_18730 [Heyndrickxia camelliae]